jgi:hypothetical protein
MEYPVPTEIQMAPLDRTDRYSLESSFWCTADHIAYQNASCAEKLRNEISQEKRENQVFIQNTERSKMIQNIQKTKQVKQGGAMQGAKEEVKLRRQFSQRSVIDKDQLQPGVRIQTTRKVLKKVFE